MNKYTILILVLIFIFFKNNKENFSNESINKIKTLTKEEIDNLRKGQLIMTNMLREFDKICRENGLKYWCTGGTLIGAIRHKGWIPHDADIDVSMLEEDYEKLKPIIQNKLSKDFGSKLIKLVQSIHKKCGTVFNLDSPKQLSEVLFDKLGISSKGLKKTASGYFSTSENILQRLAEENEVVKEILEYRSLAKLKSTYTDKISEICDQNSRVHTSYHQAVTSTGRLSSSDPNLQNIPIRTNEGITIREAFIAPAGKKVLAIDYSQIELRLMAHYSQDRTMLESFHNNEDIHKRTAAEIFGLSLDEISPEMRRQAKTINFGLLYGMSAFGLSNQLKVSRTEAEIFLNSYFEKYSSVKGFMEDIVEQTKKTKFVKTLYGRKIHVPNIDSPNYMLRQAAERIAINGPLQGSAADIIKIAMIQISDYLQEKKIDVDLIMQVHDELVFEIPQNFTETDIDGIVQIMESSTEISVPLKVDFGMGANWKEAH